MNIHKGTKVTLHYTLTYDHEDGELIEETQDDEPLTFTMGEEEMLDAFEEKILGLNVSDKFSFTLEPNKAFGPIQEELIAEYAKEHFMVEGEIDEDFLQEGEIIEMTDEDENILTGIIEENKVNSVVVNFNHPLAGEKLHFKGFITQVS